MYTTSTTGTLTFDQLCPVCGGYTTLPTAWYSTVPPRLCTCPRPPRARHPVAPAVAHTGWICPRCGRGNAPHTRSCDCVGPCITWSSGTAIATIPITGGGWINGATIQTTPLWCSICGGTKPTCCTCPPTESTDQ